MTANKKILVLIAAVLLALGAFALWNAQTHPENVATGRRDAPAFSLPDASGKTHSLAEAGGVPVVLHFWASWCPPCIEEIPHWVELAKSFNGRPARFVAVSLDDKFEEAQKVLKPEMASPNLVSILDATKKLPDAYGTYQFPETYLIDSHGKIAHKWVGPQNWQDPQIAAAIEAAAH